MYVTSRLLILIKIAYFMIDDNIDDDDDDGDDGDDDNNVD